MIHDYRWLQILNLEVNNAHFMDDIASLARRTRIPVGVVEDILSGRYVPDNETLTQLVTGLVTSIDARALILAEYEDEVDPNLLEELNDPPPKSDTRLLADAINNLAEAIREATNRKV